MNPDAIVPEMGSTDVATNITVGESKQQANQPDETRNIRTAEETSGGTVTTGLASHLMHDTLAATAPENVPEQASPTTNTSDSTNTTTFPNSGSLAADREASPDRELLVGPTSYDVNGTRSVVDMVKGWFARLRKIYHDYQNKKQEQFEQQEVRARQVRKCNSGCITPSDKNNVYTETRFYKTCERLVHNNKCNGSNCCRWENGERIWVD